MKIAKKIKLKILSILFICLCYAGWANADLQIDSSDFLVEVGLNYLEQGRTEDAMHEFSKALMLNPDNQEAIELLNEMGLEEGLYTNVKTRTSEISELAGSIKTYKDMVADLEKQKQDIETKFAQLKTEQNSLYQAKMVKELEAEILNDKIQSFGQDDQGEKQTLDARLKQMEEFYTDVSREAALEKRTYQEQNLALLQQEDQLRSYLSESYLYENQLAELSAKYNALRENVLVKDLKDNALLQDLEEYLYVRRHELDEMADQLVFREIDLLKNENQLTSTLEDLMALQSKVSQYEQALNENSSLLESQEDQLRAYRSELSTVSKELQRLIEKARKIK